MGTAERRDGGREKGVAGEERREVGRGGTREWEEEREEGAESRRTALRVWGVSRRPSGVKGAVKRTNGLRGPFQFARGSHGGRERLWRARPCGLLA